MTSPSPSPLASTPAPAEPLPRDPALERLRAAFAQVPSVLVCYSGGTDSALVLALAHRLLGERAIGMTAVSPSLAPSERDEAIALAREIGARHELVASNEIEEEGYAKNGADRCFHCKSELYRVAAKKQVEWGLACTMNGTNTDDLGDYRPGLDAARASNVKSPLVEAGLGKSEVRRIAALLGLRVWDKPAAACLSSRLPYGTRVTRERLEQIASFEASLKALSLRQVRVRWHGLPELDGQSGGAFARVEVATDELAAAFAQRDAIVAAGKRAGFVYVTLDLEGYRVGSHNAVLVGKSLRVLS
ncbi:MAG: ATP-dependent sacrificial sulfur transferase LarE [Myxococcales bacterium]|nr:ATP-dependent sacrificial sulfur transferase LarE [Myxococcales bacterium]HQY63609.1 ATP-dependent sacrificial sulfur transferase LarE [Polyangiaceae bacterium]